MSTPELVLAKKLHEQEISIQRQVAFATGLFQGDVTIRTFLESLAEGVVIIDSLGTILLVNTHAEQMFGYSHKEIVGKPHAMLLPERFRKAHEEHVAHFFEEPKIRPMGLGGLELAGCHQDGSEFPVEISLSFLETINGRLAMAFISDITRRKETEQTLKDRNQELDAFAHTLAHDMKGSLNLMLSHCQYIEMSAKDISLQRIQESVGKIWKSGVKLNQIVEGLLLLSSVSRVSVTSEPFDMAALVAEAIERLEALIDRRKAVIKLPDHFPEALGYGPWVEEILYNYIGNAIKYGGTPPVVQIGGTVRDDGFVDFWVQDNGLGLTAEEQVGIFEYGRPLKESTEDSYGLGLSIVKRIAEKLNGQVAVKSGVAGGCIFTFSLPLAETSIE
jgi:PAS domain S-box-containing protein